ncbi:hypothetical protein SEVIR_5G040000v4 [Setaria viridis]|uniref:Uncharacterized protein n=1 Tax=Setaria viridis TaxID=4556 RepID=A0A4U6UDB1_SETVI|nr:hypothetical protein SEVIR_5G040000v2 [Setaria viridis]
MPSCGLRACDVARRAGASNSRRGPRRRELRTAAASGLAAGDKRRCRRPWRRGRWPVCRSVSASLLVYISAVWATSTPLQIDAMPDEKSKRIQTPPAGAPARGGAPLFSIYVLVGT